jgi:hypothetical protein
VPKKARRLNLDEGRILKAQVRLETADNRNLRLTLGALVLSSDLLHDSLRAPLIRAILNDQLDAVPVTTCIAGSFWVDKEPSAAGSVPP